MFCRKNQDVNESDILIFVISLSLAFKFVFKSLHPVKINIRIEIYVDCLV